MERRNFLKLALGFGCAAAAGAVLRTTDAVAAPLAPLPLNEAAPSARDQHVEPAVGSQDEADRLAPEQVRWGHHGHHHGHHGHGHHWGWRRRHWGWRRRHWGWRHHHRHWHRHWHRRHHW
ncbi:twin-arginine translocation signal domain-containing protein [Bradyrhizobium sp. HKCCYLRH1065]|uniref:twin-arginine translocation signal domain-containing protein n=1 Tax=unclassified Bradyrhizobium TaxID=2631580 RepID=UPI003EB91298